MKLSARMVLSPNSVAGGAPFVVVKLITMGGFARDAPKAQNGFILRENCFVRPETTTQFSEKTNHFRRVSPQLKVACQVPHACANTPDAAAVMLSPHPLHTHFTFFC
ncbi:hypothetical protein [Bradyrhizobium shewense]|uniref:hypothetical protein n=1 Tax=Bradyrhizobium shewense TaxID=1761772 RepID=UPI00101ADA94|nr:hypothetical protein [Bradyrhizobium shewense]